MNQKRFLSLTLGAALLLAGSLNGPDLSIANAAGHNEATASSVGEARPTETKETKYTNEELFRRLSDAGALGLSRSELEAKKRAIGEALSEDRRLPWTGADLQPPQLRAALSLQPHSVVACSFDQAGMTLTETGFVSRSMPADPNGRPTIERKFALGPIGRNLDKINDAASYSDVRPAIEGSRWSERKKIGLCRAMEAQTGFHWTGRMLSQAELRQAFSLPPASSEVRCTYKLGVMTLTERA